MQVLMLSFFILTIVFTLIFAAVLIANITIGMAVFAKKKSSDKANG